MLDITPSCDLHHNRNPVTLLANVGDVATSFLICSIQTLHLPSKFKWSNLILKISASRLLEDSTARQRFFPQGRMSLPCRK